ncbi:hypothetical protein SLE2022_287180 [Rubroshorea leprosula]
MARSSFSRLFSSISEISTPKLTSTCARSDFASYSATRLLCSTSQQPQINRQSAVTGEKIETTEKDNLEIEDKVDEENGAEDDDHVNKETGEVGGPRGPEPTRYGDWERNGRCSDF